MLYILCNLKKNYKLYIILKYIYHINMYNIYILYRIINAFTYNFLKDTSSKIMRDLGAQL